MKGLCPFHDEKSPSSTSPRSRGIYHCFGCQAGGDVIKFVMEMDGLGFTETVERLAEKVGVQLRYEEGGPARPRSGPQRPRLIEAHKLDGGVVRRAAGHPRGAHRPPVPRPRGFDADAAAHFGVGFSPRGGEDLLKHLRQKGFTDEELVTSGPDRPGRPRALRPVPGPADVADPRQQRRHDRLRRPADLRRRPDRGEVPQHPRDPDLQEEPGALRHRPRPPRDRARQPGRDRRGLHRRDGLPPRRREDRRGHLRHRRSATTTPGSSAGCCTTTTSSAAR